MHTQIIVVLLCVVCVCVCVCVCVRSAVLAKSKEGGKIFLYFFAHTYTHTHKYGCMDVWMSVDIFAPLCVWTRRRKKEGDRKITLPAMRTSDIQLI